MSKISKQSQSCKISGTDLPLLSDLSNQYDLSDLSKLSDLSDLSDLFDLSDMFNLSSLSLQSLSYLAIKDASSVRAFIPHDLKDYNKLHNLHV